MKMPIRNLCIVIICLICVIANAGNACAGKIIDKSSEGYFLYLPQTAISGKTSPVLVCLPGWGVSAKHDINMWGFPAEKNDFVVINFDIDYSSIKSVSDVKKLYNRIKKTIDVLSSLYPIDTQRIYIAGTSAGGMMSISLALMYPDEFIAIGVICGARLGFSAQKYLKNAKGINFYMIHGKKDKSIPIREFHSTVKRLKKYGAIVKFDIIKEGRHILPSSAYRKTVDWLSIKKK